MQGKQVWCLFVAWLDDNADWIEELIDIFDSEENAKSVMTEFKKIYPLRSYNIQPWIVK